METATSILNGYSHALEAEVVARVAAARTLLDHNGSKGQLVESAFNEALQNVLGGRFRIGNGQIIDARARRSGQVDLIFYNDYQILPPRNSADPGLFLVDGVDAVLEVKTELTSAHVETILKNACNGRGPKHVKRSFNLGDQIPDLLAPTSFARFYMAPAYGLIAAECKMSPERLLEKLAILDTTESVLNGGKSNESRYHLPPLDAVFVLGMGEFRNKYELPKGGPASMIHRPNPDLTWGNWEFFSSANAGSSITSTILATAAWLHAVTPMIERMYPPALHYFAEPGGTAPSMSWTPAREYVVKHELERLAPHVHPPVQ